MPLKNLSVIYGGDEIHSAEASEVVKLKTTGKFMTDDVQIELDLNEKTQSDLVVSGDTVTVPSGYYAAQVSATVDAGSATTPATAITANPTLTLDPDAGVVSGAVSESESVTPTVVEGYVTSGTAGTVSVSGSGTLNLATTSVTEGTTTVSGSTATRGKAEWNRGWIQSGEIAAAAFGNAPASGKTAASYVDISNTTAAPVLITEDYLYINQGYTDNLKISLAKLIPDGASADLAAGHILSGYSAYDNDGKLIAGTIPTKSSATVTNSDNVVTVEAGYYPENVTHTVGTAKAAAAYNVSSSDQTIASGQYLTGAQTIKAVATEGISAANVKYGVDVKVGDDGDDDRIIGVTGTFTGASTVSSGQTAATAGQILSGYSAWVDGAEVKGNIAAKTSADLTVSGPTVTAPAGFYGSDASATVATGALSASATGSATVDEVAFAYNSTSGKFDVTGSESITGTATATVNTAGYVTTGTTGSTTGTAGVAATANKIVGSTTITGDSTKKPAIGRTDTSASGATNVGTGTASTSAPSSGYFVSVQSPANTGTLTATPGVTTAGYGTTANHGITGNTATVGALASDVTYITVASGSATTPATAITANPTFSFNSTTGVITANAAATESVTPTVSTGYVTAGTAGTVTVSGTNTYALSLYAGAIEIVS